MTSTVLYISYDGMLEPLGQSQVIAYQEGLATANFVVLMSFEKSHDSRNTLKKHTVGQRLKAANIKWYPCRYHKRPTSLATALDIVVGIAVGLWLVLRHRIHIIHARSYVAGVMGLVLKKLTGVKFIFDMRGFWADERVEGGIWRRESRLFKVAKWCEQRLLLNADHIVSLTHAGITELEKFPYMHQRMPATSVISTCTDLTRFHPSVHRAQEQFVLGYVGSAGTWYLFDEVARLFALLLTYRPTAKLLILNRNEHELIAAALKKANIGAENYNLVAAEHADVPNLMGQMSAGVFFIKPVFSKQASAPTKLGEFLGCGLPCISNWGVGDMSQILSEENTGVAVESFDDASLHTALLALLQLADDPDTPTRARATAIRHFSLIDGINRYQAIYDSLS